MRAAQEVLEVLVVTAPRDAAHEHQHGGVVRQLAPQSRQPAP